MRLVHRSSVLAALAPLVACALSGCARPAGAGDRRSLRVALLRQPATSLLLVAQDLGCFAREELAIEERPFELGKDALVALANEEVEVAVAYETPVLRTYQGDRRLRALGTLHTSTRNTRIVARRDAGIGNVRDLRGARIGSPRGTNADFFLETLLTFGGIDRATVEVVDLPPDRAAAALTAGEIQAAALFDPYAAEAQAALGERAVEIQSDLYTEYSLLITREEVVASRRAELEALLRGLLCAERATQERAPAAFQALQRRFPARSEAQLRVALSRVKRTVALDGLLMTVLRREADWLWASSGSPGNPPDTSRLVDGSLLAEVDPEAVNIPASPERPWRP